MKASMLLRAAFLAITIFKSTIAVLTATETTAQYILANERLYAAVNKSTGAVQNLLLDGQDLLGASSYIAPISNGSTGNDFTRLGPYLDCYCIPSGVYTPGRVAPRYKLINGTDSLGIAFGGVVMSETYPETGQVLEQYWFLKDDETGLHTFSRLAYHNKLTPFLRNLQELRTLFRPNSSLWTNLSTNAQQYAPLPSANSTAVELTVQDATWYLGASKEDPYVIQESDYFTKYMFQNTWRDHSVHGIYSDGSTSDDGSTFGAWLVMNTKDTYFGGPLHSDLTVDGIVYNYLVSNHHGASTPNITDGFDRTFGPQYYHFNRGPPGTSLETLRQDALQYSSPTWNTAFYDSIAQYVPNYVPSSERATWIGHITLPPGATSPIAILSQNSVDFQDNALDPTAYQYWGNIDPITGTVYIPRIKAGVYRATVYASGIFGNYIQDNISILAGQTASTDIVWAEESAGQEIWRIGVPDKSAGEFRHGYTADPAHPHHPEEYRLYWPVFDFPSEFPDGVRFMVGESREDEDFNYVHWSVFGGYANSIRPEPYLESVNNWTVVFELNESQLEGSVVTLTVQLAGAKTAAGNTDLYNASQPWSNLEYTVAINERDLEPWVIPYYHSSSCAVRSAVICYNIDHKFTFDAALLVEGINELTLSLPANATDYESAVLPTTVYVQYDALRLEIK